MESKRMNTQLLTQKNDERKVSDLEEMLKENIQKQFNEYQEKMNKLIRHRNN
jgi:hypothetical protein